MVKDDSLYIIAIVAVVAVVGLVIMATGSSSTVMVAEDLPSMAEESDDAAIAGEAFRTGSSSKLYDRGYGVKSVSSGSVSSGSVSSGSVSSAVKLSAKSPYQQVCESYLFKKLGCTYNPATDFCECPDLTGDELVSAASDLE